VKNFTLMGMSVTFRGDGAFLRISLVVFNVRLLITLRRLGEPLPSSLVGVLEQSRAVLAGAEDPPPVTTSPPTAAVPLLGQTSPWDSLLLAYKKRSGDVL